MNTITTGANRPHRNEASFASKSARYSANSGRPNVDVVHDDYDGRRRFVDLSLLDMFPYCTGVFVHKVEEARAHNPADPPLDALVKELELEAYAHAKGCRLHGIVTVEEVLELIEAGSARAASQPRTHAATVRCATAQPHHFAVIWTN